MNELESSPLPLERVYSFPFDAFDAINTAVWYVLSRADPLHHHQPEQISTGRKYLISWNQVLAHLFVLRITAQTTIIRIHVLMPTDPIQAILWRKDHMGNIADAFLDFLGVIDEQVTSLLRQAAKAEGYLPHPPTKPRDILTWWLLYCPEKTIPEVVKLIEQMDGRRIPERTLYNERSKGSAEGAPKTSNRGRKR